jgi:hypothetical protein
MSADNRTDEQLLDAVCNGDEAAKAGSSSATATGSSVWPGNKSRGRVTPATPFHTIEDRLESSWPEGTP